MLDLIDLIKDNKEWLFSGLGIVIISSVVRYSWQKVLTITVSGRVLLERLQGFKLTPSHVMLLTAFIFSSCVTFMLGYAVFKPDPAPEEVKEELSPSEERIIAEYVKKTSIEDGIGQLFMVGVPADFNTFKDVSALDDILGRLGIGNVIVNGYNFYNQKYDDTTFLDALIVFINALQEKSTRSQLSLPLLLATDFESSSFTSIKTGLISPPSALSIGAARNKNITYDNGVLVGTQLRNVGIHLLLGPVLDSYNIKQSNRSTLQDRCFSGSPLGVVSIGSHFIKGVRESGLRLICKHFPSYGSIEDNPHDPVIPKYEGSPEQLQSEIKPILYLEPLIDGLMTSHALIPRLDNKIATFSQTFVKKYLVDSGFDQQILLTDDLTSMGSIKTYAHQSGDGFGEIAVKAFAAGHNILMFSHFSEIDKRSSFSLKDLELTRNSLIKFIKSSKEMESHFRNSLSKILTLKAKIAKAKHISVEALLDNQSRSPVFHIPYNGKEAQAKCKNGIAYSDDRVKSPEDLVRNTINKGCTLISRNASYDLSSYPSEAKVYVYVYGAGLHQFHANIKPLFGNAEFTEIPVIKSSKEFRKLRNHISSNIEAADVVIYTVYDKSDADLLLQLKKASKGFAKKAILLCHNSPMIFDHSILSEFTVIATFTNHPFSYDVDMDVLLRHCEPQGMNNLPISIGDGGKIYNVASTSFIEPTNVVAYEKIVPKYLLDEKTVMSIMSSNYLIPRYIVNDVLPKALFLLINWIMGFVCCRGVITALCNVRAELKEGNLFMERIDIIKRYTVGNAHLILSICVAVIINLTMFSSECIIVWRLIRNIFS